jgi:RNA polymerase sigma factor (sigma-70 family)
LQPSQTSSEQIESYWKMLLDGNRSGLEGIYRSFFNDLFQFGCSIVLDEHLIKDLIQELFLDLWKYHSNLPATEKVKHYLFKCLSNKISKSFNDDKRRLQIGFENSCFQDKEMESIEAKLVHLNREEEIQQKLSRAMGKLPIRQKEVINCLFFEKFSYEETSKVMELNLRSVYTLAWKAISSLKKSFLDSEK